MKVVVVASFAALIVSIALMAYAKTIGMQFYFGIFWALSYAALVSTIVIIISRALHASRLNWMRVPRLFPTLVGIIVALISPGFQLLALLLESIGVSTWSDLLRGGALSHLGLFIGLSSSSIFAMMVSLILSTALMSIVFLLFGLVRRVWKRASDWVPHD